MTRSRAALLLLLVAALGTGCGGSGAAPARTGTPAPPPPSASSTSAPPSPSVPSATPLPPILVESPAAGATVTSPVTVSGRANVYEGQFQVELRDAAGTVLAHTAVTAGGTGTDGSTTGAHQRFGCTLAYRVSRTQQGRLVAFDRSARDGSVIDVVTVPVVLRATDLPDGRQAARITRADATAWTVVVNVVEFFQGADAARAAAQDGAPEVPPANDHWIRDTSPRLRTLPVDPAVTVTVDTLASAETGSAVKVVPRSFAWLAGAGDVGGALFWITLDGGRVVRIAEQYLP